MSQCEGPDCTHSSHKGENRKSKPSEMDSHGMAMLIARERANQRPLTVAEAESLALMTPEGREEFLEERRKKYAAAVGVSPRDCFTGEFTVNTATAGQVINIAVSALRKIGGGSGLGAKLEARQALMQMQKICEENKMIPRAPENKAMTDTQPDPNGPTAPAPAEEAPKPESSSEEKEPAPQADDASAPEPQQGVQ